MANYKRVISYMYAYRNQLKGNNVGFARIENRGNECKITLHVRVVNMKDQEIGSYMYCWYNRELHAVYLGDIHISSGIGELVVKTDVDNIMNSRYRFTEMGGILLYCSDAQYIATEWDGKAVLFDEIKIDTVKPNRFTELTNGKAQSRDSSMEGDLRAAELNTESIPSQEPAEEKLVEIETAVAVMVPEEEQEKVDVQATDMEKSLDEMIEDEVAKEEEAQSLKMVEQQEAEQQEAEQQEAEQQEAGQQEVEQQETGQQEVEQQEVEQQETGQQEVEQQEVEQQEVEQQEAEQQEVEQQEVEQQEAVMAGVTEELSQGKSEEVPEEEERPGTFPLSQEKMEHLDQQAQELFGTMLLNTLFPPKKKEEKEAESKEEAAEEKKEPVSAIEAAKESRVEQQESQKETEKTVSAADSKPEPEMKQVQERPADPEEPVKAEEAGESENPVLERETISINPKSAIQCLTAFRSCESAKEYEEIQEEIHTLRAQVKYLERICDEWKIKEARLLEMKETEEEITRENQKLQIENKIREEYNIDGIHGELKAAEVKRAVTERIFQKYPKMQPFKADTVKNCVRIEPQDLGVFPMENWILANNSFLLHGYYSYRHLIFVMEKEDGRDRYLLGVPGVNHSRERFMANMFGFSIFKTLETEENETGEFGYWCHEIII